MPSLASPSSETLSTTPLPAWLKTSDGHEVLWLDSGRELLAAQLQAIEGAQSSIRLEQYIYRASDVASRYREAMTAAARRGVSVTVLIDHAGSISLPGDYFSELESLGGKLVWFNPVRRRFWSFRDHRKLLVVDDDTAFIGGCNIAPEYEGDGITEGWRDGGIGIRGPVVQHLASAFEKQVDQAPKQIWKVRRQSSWGRIEVSPEVTLLLTRPGFHQNAFDEALRQDLHNARDVAITCAYFLPPGRTRRALQKAARRAERFRLLLAGKCDVPMFQSASRAQYRKFQGKGAQIYEYQPQVLHAKTLVVDDAVYVGSSNLDPRSLSINFEMMIRIESPELARQALATFQRDLEHSTLVEKVRWRRPTTWWKRLKQKIAWWLFVRLDLSIAQSMLQEAEQRGGRR